ncbi:MotA/TolQ/ExbB proton channel family protein [Anoxybacillus sp. MB8]|uniref:MotA/TolQ/ExbB proton channel family protein n=1 Tax=Anoxybacillus sp. MB8 TaxID=2496850 RepID=UPI001F08FBD0|nr:MotA/TolQ/ExbB proton channel family protein [Anoxybacillus sp. MB8]
MNQLKPKLMEFTRSSNAAPNEVDQELNALFANVKKSKYKELWERYFERVSQKNEDERINVDPFFGFDVMHYHMGYRHLMDMGAGIHVSIGVLGTFIGLSVGLSELHIGDTESLRFGIESLLDGMKVAFYTSVWGVFLSLLWTVFDRWISSRLDKSIDWHSEKLDFLLSTDDEELFLNRLEKISRNQADHLKTLLTDALEKAMQPVVATIQHSQGNIQSAFGQLTDQFSRLQAGVENQSELLRAQIELTKNTSHDVANRLIDQITGGTQQSITHFTTLVQDAQRLQQEMMGTISKVVENFVSTEKSQAMTLERTEKMFEQFEKMALELEEMRNHYKETANVMENLGLTFQHIQQMTQEQLPVQHEVIKSNQILVQKYSDLTEGFKQFNAQLETKYETLLQQIVTTSDSLSHSFKEMAERFERSLVTQQKTLQDSEVLLTNIQSIVAMLTPLAPNLKEVVGKIERLQEQLSQMQKVQNELLPELVSLRTQTNETVENALQTTKTYLQDITKQLEVLEGNWTTTREQFTKITDALHLSMKDFAENIDNGLSKTYHHFDETLTKAVQEVSNLVYQFSEVQSEFIDTLEEVAEHLGKMKAGASS